MHNNFSIGTLLNINRLSSDSVCEGVYWTTLAFTTEIRSIMIFLLYLKKKSGGKFDYQGNEIHIQTPISTVTSVDVDDIDNS